MCYLIILFVTFAASILNQSTAKIEIIMEKETTKDEIKKMEVGETASFPIERFAVIRTYAYEVGLLMNRTYRTAIDKEKRTITVVREA